MELPLVSAILFDLDGTIVDNLKNIIDSYQYALTELGKTVSDHELRGVLGHSLKEMAHIFDIPYNDQLKFQNLYTDHLSNLKNQMVHGMKAVLEEIKRRGIPLGIVTSKLQNTTTKLLEELSITQYFDVVITSIDTKRLKPHPDPLILACHQLDVSPSKNIIYIGDTINDMIASKSANLRSFGVTWGVSRESICMEPDVICISDPKKILAKSFS